MERFTAYFQIFAVIFYVLSVVVEMVVSIRQTRKDYYEKRDTRVNLLSMVGMGIVARLNLIPTLLFMEWISRQLPYELPVTWWSALLTLLLVDHSNYWAHRFSHRTNIGWAMHVTHHSSKHYNLSVALRQSWTQVLLTVFFVPIVFLGVPVYVILFGKAINSFGQFWLHTEYIGRMPRWFSFIFNTPSHHRVHHASDEHYLDKNYGGLFIIFDRLYGTFKAEAERPTYGLTTNIERQDLVYVQFHHWQSVWRNYWRAPDWRTRWRVLFAPPGEQAELPEIARQSYKPWMPLARLAAPKSLHL